ncbi:DUF7827 domain-containing protein [Haloarchaeobius litoreus]|uniref:DUF7827 domain-containing protein n=2 Tax=Haloarchaeobius litoreus TaxID=755306 RepID=A0ABD6DMB7_9EURY|nr:hypothetical protein [Haloarchaeobius litoreus]
MARGRTVTCVCLLVVAVVATAGAAGTVAGAEGTATGAEGTATGAEGTATGAEGAAVDAATSSGWSAPQDVSWPSQDLGQPSQDVARPSQDEGWSVPNGTDEQPGDVVRIPVGFAGNETEATVVIENESLGYRLVVRVVDENRDGVAVLNWNTYHAGSVPAEAVANRTVAADEPDRVLDARRTTPQRDGRLDEGHYTVSVRHDDSVVAEDVVVLESDPLRRSSITVLEGPPLADASTAFARSGISGTIEQDEWLFVLVERQSIHGYVDGIEDLTGNGTDGVTFHITRGSDGPMVDLSNATFLHFPQHDEFVVGVPPNATVFEPDTDYVARFVVARSNPYAGGGQVSSSTEFRVLPAGAQPDRPVLEVVDVRAPETVIEGREATFAVSVVNSGEREGTATVVVGLEGTNVTREVTVGPRSQETVRVAFDTSPLTEGVTRWDVRIAGGARTVTGELEVRLTNETRIEDPTLVPGPRRTSDGGQPGFGALAALVGLGIGIGGRVLALQRE